MRGRFACATAKILSKGQVDDKLFLARQESPELAVRPLAWRMRRDKSERFGYGGETVKYG
jgi:hypothetical protein